MIIKLKIENFKSFKEKAEFSMVEGNFKRHNAHVYKIHDDVKILRSAAIYGSNAAGKSNLILALEFVKRLVVNGTDDVNEEIPIKAFKLDKDCEGKPTSFQIDFHTKDKIYLYSISILRGVIVLESLYIRKSPTELAMVFKRVTDEHGHKTELKFKKHHKDKGISKERMRREIYQESLRFNQPFLTEGYNLGMDELKPAYKWFDKFLQFEFTNRSNLSSMAYAFSLDPEILKIANNILGEIGPSSLLVDLKTEPFEEFFGVHEDFRKKHIEKVISRGYPYNFIGKDRTEYTAFVDSEGEAVVAKLVTWHKDKDGNEVMFEVAEESHGTQRLLNLIPAFIKSAKDGTVLFIDEISKSIHPSLMTVLLDSFLKSGSLKGGQLIFTTHETKLLDLEIFRQDEYWFVVKNKNGESAVYPMTDYRVRHDKDIRKGYLQGDFGAVPEVTEKQLAWE